MKRDFSRLQHEVFDLLVIGGGITGATLAWDASLRGLKVALVDQGDFGAATTTANSKLIHGGLRYLKNGEVGLVRESLRERRIFQTIAPHLVVPISFLIPTYRHGGNRRWMIKAGMVAYDMLSYDRGRLADPEQRIPRHRMLSPRQVLEEEPGVSPEGLTGGAVYHDCQCEPERLCLEFILGAAEQGAVVVNHARVTGISCRKGRVEGAEVEDLVSGQSGEVRAQVVANVAGPWADAIDLLGGAGGEVTLRRSKGIHLITRSLSRKHAVVLRTSGGGHFFIIPWRGRSLIGTTDVEYRGEPDGLAVLEEDVRDFVGEINHAYPSAELDQSEVSYRYAGVRPLVDQESQVYQASRKYEIVDHHQKGLKGFVTAVGGKYTTSRNLARKMTDLILSRLGRSQVRCGTAEKLLPGGVAGRFSEYLDRSCGVAGNLLPEDVVRHLVWRYGGRHDRVVELAKKDPSLGERIASGHPEILAQLVFAVESEMAYTLCDILTRRTGIGTLGHPGDVVLDRVAGVVARLLGWDEKRIARERQIYLDKVRGLPERAIG